MKLDVVYCPACSTELVSAGYEPYSEEHYHVCPNCSTEYTLTESNDHTVVIQADLKENYQE